MLKDEAWKDDAKTSPTETSMDSAGTTTKYVPVNWLQIFQ